MFKEVDLNNGEMGLPKDSVKPEHLRPVIKAVGDILSKLKYESHKCPVYSIQISIFDFDNDENHAYEIIRLICLKELPKNVKLYTVSGNSIFAMRGASGGITTAYVFYLMRDKD